MLDLYQTRHKECYMVQALKAVTFFNKASLNDEEASMYIIKS
jgi:hypothetical protein